MASAAFLALVLAYVPGLQTPTASLGGGEVQIVLAAIAGIAAVVAAIVALAWFKRHVVAATLVASVAVVAGMWLERWNIIIPSVTHPRLTAWAAYMPTITEWSVTAGSVALFVLLLMVFFKLFPAVSLWEVAEGRVLEEAQAKIEAPLPAGSPAQVWGARGRSRRLK
jgi:molybdopterin-containing oxidoreductase family membrane subunit